MKLGAARKQIQTVPRVGYRFSEDYAFSIQV